jgi:hypothetical protein
MLNMSNKQLDHLFISTDRVWIGDLYKENGLGPFFCINPVDDNGDRAKENITTVRNFLFEFDGDSLDAQQLGIDKLKSLNFPCSSVVFSGSQSYHLIVSLSVPLTLEYKASWLALATEITSLTSLTPDPACKNPNRLSRLAGCTRPETGLVQKLISLGPYTDNEYISGLIAKYNVQNAQSKKTAVAPDSNLNVDALKLRLRQSPILLNRIMGVDQWAGPVNMYPEVLKLTLWIIDATGAPKQTVLGYFNERLFPKLLEAGYPAEKLDKAVHNAYSYKF